MVYFKNPISVLSIPSSIYYLCLFFKYPHLWKSLAIYKVDSVFWEKSLPRYQELRGWGWGWGGGWFQQCSPDEWRKARWWADWLSCFSWKSGLAFRCPFKYRYPSLCPHHSNSPKGQPTGVRSDTTSDDNITPTKIKGCGDIWTTGRFHWSAPGLASFRQRSDREQQVTAVDLLSASLSEVTNFSVFCHSTFVPRDRDSEAVLKKVHSHVFFPSRMLKNSSVQLIRQVTIWGRGWDIKWTRKDSTPKRKWPEGKTKWALTIIKSERARGGVKITSN